MSKELVISASPHETRVAILEEGQLCEIYVERHKEFALVGSIYKGKVTRVLPGMQSSFVGIGLDSDAFLYVTDFLEDIEEYDHIVSTVEEKVQKMEEQGGRAFAVAQPLPGVSMEPPDVDGITPPESSAGALPRGAAAGATHAGGAPPRPPEPRSQQHRSRDQRGGFGRQDRGGRRGRGGRRRGGNDRELPPSKFAHHHPHDPGPSEPALDESAAGPVEHIILPGESLAKYKEKIFAQPAADAAHEVAATQALAAASAELTAAPRASEMPHAAPTGEWAKSSRHAEEERPRSIPMERSGGIEVLPGESIARARKPAPSVSPEYAFPEPAPPQEQSEIGPQAEKLAPAGIDAEALRDHRIVEPGAAHLHETDTHAELTDEEANALAEHVAEAQSEEAERAEQEHQGSEATAALDHEHGHSGDGEDHENREFRDAADHGVEDEDFSQPLATPDQSGEMESAEAAVEHGEDERKELEAEQSGEPWADEAHAAAEAEQQLGPASEQSAAPAPATARVSGNFRQRMQQPGRRGRRDDRHRRPQGGPGPSHGSSPRPQTQTRRPQLISEMLKAGQEIIVQIAKEPLGKKGARITSHIALPGRYLVYMPTLDHTGVSRKIASAEERGRLRTLINEAKGSFGGGFIVRTAAEKAAPEEVRADVEFLTRTWADIKTRAEQRKAPALLHRDLNLVERILRDYLSPEFTAVWVDSEEEFTKVVDFMSRFQPQLVNRVKLYSKETPVYEEFGIQQEIDKGLRPKVWLKSGGYIVINHTEALVAIDVNTGKFVGRGSTRLEDTIVRTNVEAAKEIVRQIRLRDLGGIIVVDFIDMEERRNREKVMAALEEALSADRAPSKVLRFNEFGLVAITRKRTKQALERTLCQPCPYCTGSGMVKSIPTLCYEIQAEARKMAPEMDAGSLSLRVHPEIAKALKTRESGLIDELEQWTKKSIIIQADPTLHWEQYDIY